MKTSQIQIKEDPDFKDRVFQLARELGLPVATVIHFYLARFIRTNGEDFKP